MAKWIHVDGRVDSLPGPLTLEQLRAMVGGDIEVVKLRTEEEAERRWVVLVVDEDGQRKEKRLNRIATVLAAPGGYGEIVGDAVLCWVTEPGQDGERWD